MYLYFILFYCKLHDYVNLQLKAMQDWKCLENELFCIYWKLKLEKRKNVITKKYFFQHPFCSVKRQQNRINL